MSALKVTRFIGAKGGQGCTTVAALHALALAQADAEVLLLDDGTGDAWTILGLPAPSSPFALQRVEGTTLTLGGRGLGSGTAALPDYLEHLVLDGMAFECTGERVLLVTRPCYLALRRALALELRPDGVVLLEEPGRSLTATDVEACLGVPVLATVPVDPATARAIDAGLVTSRLRSVSHALAGLSSEAVLRRP